MKHTFLLIISVFIFLFLGCKTESGTEDIYPERPEWSQKNGTPLDSSTFYFPTSIKTPDSIINTKLDTFKLTWYSTSLFPTKQPVLYNYYLGHDIYRLTVLRSFNPPLVFTLHKDGKNVWLQTIKLDRIPQFIPMRILSNFPPKPDDRDSIIYPDRHANIEQNSRKNLTIESWNNLEACLSKIKYWQMSPSNDDFGLDGSRWILEAHTKERYWMVERWSPKGDLRNCANYLVELSTIKEEMY